MSKRAILFFAVVVGISTIYDFYRGYHEDRSIIGGIAYVIFGLIVLAFFWWLYSKRAEFKLSCYRKIVGLLN